MMYHGDLWPADRPLIIPIFIPHLGCPHQCVFCNQRTITGSHCPQVSPQHVRKEVDRYLRFKRHPPAYTQISFFGGTFLGLGKPRVLSLLQAAQSFVDGNVVDSIRFSTRPDTIRPEIMDLVGGFAVSTIELGVQSMLDHVLDASGRGHRNRDTIEAAGYLKAKGYQVGMQMMVGLPEDEDDGAMETARRLAALKPDFVRIYPTLVLKGSPLASQHATGRYRPLSLKAAVDLVKRLLLYFKHKGIPVIRMGLQAGDGLSAGTDLIAGPYHPAFGHLVHAAITLDAITDTIEKMTSHPDPLVITTHARMISRVQGLKKNNLLQLKHRFGLKEIILSQDANLAPNRLTVAGKPVRLP
ncbi:MAG: hypothetical protein CR984_02130 [Proteobacteria bacterium]|nr:MAG: hypothetical protein CR984_02130 [Pseudomonadota bacterium]PIE67846.1 MAG: hypothetical protein CSA23_01835 [Deltaproteobacteria bacterium]